MNDDERAAPSGSSMNQRRRALIVSTVRDRGALTAARSLQQSGWTVGVGAPGGRGMLGSSNACTAQHLVPRPRYDGTAFIEGVRQAVNAGSYDVVFGGGDDSMAALSAYREDIPAVVAHPSAQIVEAALDKMKLAECAGMASLAAPYTELATAQAVAAWQGPVVVKCRAHWSHGQTRPHRIEAKLFENIGSARHQIERLEIAGAEPILQRPVSGHLGALIGVFHEGRLHGRVQQATSRLWPTPNGASARAETVPIDNDLAAKAEKLLSGLGWSGLVELQFLTGNDGIPHLIDLNGRFYGSLALANVARPGLIDAWARMVLGEPMADLPDGRPGIRYAWTAGDLRRAVVERRNGMAADIVDTLLWARGATHSVWDIRDPRPAWNLISGRLRLPASKAGPRLASSLP